MVGKTHRKINKCADHLLLTGVDVDGIAGEYVFKPNNPFMDDLHSFAKAKSLFRHGILSEAVYALEAEVGVHASPHSLILATPLTADSKYLPRVGVANMLLGIENCFPGQQPVCLTCSSTFHLLSYVTSALTQG